MLKTWFSTASFLCYLAIATAAISPLMQSNWFIRPDRLRTLPTRISKRIFTRHYFAKLLQKQAGRAFRGKHTGAILALCLTLTAQ